MSTLDQGPLTDDEINELDQFLLNAEGIDESMDISTLDGYLTAIICGPRTIMPSEWMRWVWDMERGEDAPEFASEQQAQRILGLMMRHMNDIAQTLRLDPDHYEPLLTENPNDGDPIPILDEWCCGFLKGVNLDAVGWLPVTAGKPEWMSTLMLYGTEEGWERLKNKNLALDEHRALAHGLAETVRKIHGLWLAQRRPPGGALSRAARSEPVRHPDKVGRNDPCPCGSGKKFKQCHGNPVRLHWRSMLAWSNVDFCAVL